MTGRVLQVLSGVAAAFLADVAPASPVDLVPYVDPMIGAVTYADGRQADIHGFGKTFPGAATPFGMVQLSPDTVTGGDNGSGYSYSHNTIEGFSFLHMSGVGWYGEFGNFQVMVGGKGPSAFSHANESAEAGFYRVRLDDAKTLVEATATPDAGLLRFTFEDGGEQTLTIDLARRIGELSRAKPHGRQSFEMEGRDAFKGSIVCDHRDGGWGRGAGKVDYTVYFHGVVSKPFSTVEKRGGETNLTVVATLPVATGESVTMKVAISFDEIPPRPEAEDFDTARANARRLWKEAFDVIEVESGTERERTIFATALYHAFLDPRAIGRGDGYVRRTVFSGWDVFRSEMPLLCLVRPDVVRDTILSMMDVVKRGDRETLPVWDIFGCRSGCMIGNPMIPVMATAVQFGITNFDTRAMYELAKDTSAKRGNAPCGFTPGSLSETLEYCYDDWCMMKLAERYGTPEDVRNFAERARWYTNCWDRSVGWFRTRNADGTWLEPWQGRTCHGQGCVESNPWQQGWFVPHDPDGLAALMGGRAACLAELELFFSETPKNFLWNDAYNHANEPVHHATALFAAFGRKDLAVKWTRTVCASAYGTGPYGLCGNDDVGQMSAWYVLAAIGRLPLDPAAGVWHSITPIFDRVRLKTSDSSAGCDTNVVRLPAGDVALSETMVVGPESSGKIFRGASDGSTRITGAIAVGPWEDCGGGVWAAKLPFGADGKPVYTESLFVNGRRAARARFPDKGYFHPPGEVEEAACPDSRTGWRQTVALPPEAAAKVAAVPASELAFAQLVAHIKWDAARYPIVAFANGGLSVDGAQMPSWNRWTKNDLYCLENLRSAFDAPGEWFCDASAGEILYRTLPGETVREASIPCEGLETLVAVKGAGDVAFENVTFAMSAPTAGKGPSRLSPWQAAARVSSAAVTVDFSTNIVFRNCRFENTGGYALWFRERVYGGGAFSCEMTDLGAGGVRIGSHSWKKGEETTSGVTVDDCLIADGGRFHPAGVGVLIAHASDCSVVHNEIRDLFYTGVSVGWTWGYAGSPSQRNTVAFNLIHDIGRGELADMGGIYTLGTSFGTCVSNNVIHGVHSYSYGGWGLYTDEGCEGITLENNLVYDTDDASFYQHYGRDNVLRNNILVDSANGQVAVARAEDHRSLTCERNIVIWSKGDAFIKYTGTKSERAKIDWRGNLWWRIDGKGEFNGTSFDDWRMRVKDEGSVFADPLFADWKAHDFTLSPESPALKLGFVPFDASLAGRRGK